jgi:arginine-tRNA-protein transferase
MTERRPINSGGPGPLGPYAAPKPFYVLRELPCPYLPGRQERKVITDLSGSDAQAVHGDLSRAGFRRSHMFAYRPACRGCDACVPVRVDTPRHAPTKSQRRIMRKNADLTVGVQPAQATAEQYAVFARYLKHRHGQGEMADMSQADYRDMVEQTAVSSRLAEFRDGDGRLLAGMIFDVLDDGTSAVYAFFDPDEDARSLGTYTVLWLIDQTAQWPGRYVYLGYWVAGSRKMAYKSRFQALERLTPSGWRPFDA